MKVVHIISFILLVIGGLNWGLIGINDYNLVETLLGSWPVVESVVYILVGLSAIEAIITHKKLCKHCEVTAPVSSGM